MKKVTAKEYKWIMNRHLCQTEGLSIEEVLTKFCEIASKYHIKGDNQNVKEKNKK